MKDTEKSFDYTTISPGGGGGGGGNTLIYHKLNHDRKLMLTNA